MFVGAAVFHLNLVGSASIQYVAGASGDVLEPESQMLRCATEEAIPKIGFVKEKKIETEWRDPRAFVTRGK